MTPTGHVFALNQSLFSLGGDLWIDDEAGNRAFEVDGKAMSLRRSLELRDAAGATLYTLNQSLAHVRRTFEIKRNGEIVATVEEAVPMSKARRKKKSPKRVLALPDLEHAKSAVLNSLTSKERAAHIRSCDH